MSEETPSIERCAALHAEGETEAAARMFKALRGQLPHPASLQGWPRVRLEILVELEWLRPFLKTDPELFVAIARAALVSDEQVLDDLIERRILEKRAPSPEWLAGAPHLHSTYAAAYEVPASKLRIRNGVRVGIALAALTVVGLILDLGLPNLLRSWGFHFR